jgi:hypothetical protein
MLLNTVHRAVESSTPLRGAVATIKASPKIFDMFENSTYANKPLAIMRELVANGIDAHVAAGTPNRPVEVKLPNPLDPTCIIRDFGVGMSQLFILGDETTPSKFMAYTDGSTKDKDNGAIGGFGIGSKSPFSYVDQYTLRVVHDGVLSVYTMYKNEDNLPAVALQAETTTDEPNGVEVSFPVEDADMEAFSAATQEALQYFQPLPIVTGGTLNAPDYSFVGNGWAMRRTGGELGIIMGGVRYPATKASMAYDLRYGDKVSPLLDFGLDLTMPIGACAVAMSREALQYTSETNAALKLKLESVIDDVIATFADFFKDCKSEWDAMAKLHAETSAVTGGRSQLLGSNARYRGQPLATSFSLKPNDLLDAGLTGLGTRLWRVERKRNRRGANCPTSDWRGVGEVFGIAPGEIDFVIIDDLPQSPKSATIKRIREYVTDNQKSGYVLVARGEDEHQTDKLLKLLKSPSEYVLASSIPEPVKAARGKPTTQRPRVRMFTYTGEVDKYTQQPITNLTPAMSKIGRVAEIAYQDQPSSGIMVVMESSNLPVDLHRKMKAGVIRWGELHFVNQIDAPKLRPAFRDFDAVFAERLAAALAKSPDLPARIALSSDGAMSRLSDDFEAVDGYMDDLSAAASSRPFAKLYAAWRTYIKPLTGAEKKLAPFVEAKLPANVNPLALRQAMRTRTPETEILLEVLELNKEDHRKLFLKNL